MSDYMCLSDYKVTLKVKIPSSTLTLLAARPGGHQ